MSGILVYMTASSMEEAQTIGRHLIKERLAACVNIFPQMRSIYEWQETITVEPEVVVIAKTQADLFEELAHQVKALHSYDTPAILEIPLGRIDPPYHQWLTNQTKRR